MCKGTCLDELKAIGLSYDRLEFQRGLRAADVREGKTATHDKGFFAPVPVSSTVIEIIQPHVPRALLVFRVTS